MGISCNWYILNVKQMDVNSAQVCAEQLMAVLQWSNNVTENFELIPSDGSPSQQSKNEFSSTLFNHQPSLNAVDQLYQDCYRILLPACAWMVDELAALLSKTPTMVTHLQIGRSLIETLARIWWLRDPRIDIATRVARFFTCSLDVVYEGRKLELTDDAKSMWSERISMEVRKAQNAGLSPRRDKFDNVIGFESSTMYEKTTLVKTYLTDLDINFGDVWYRLMSGAVHLNEASILTRTEMQPIRDTNHMKLVGVIPSDEIIKVTAIAIRGFVRAVSGYIDDFGHASINFESIDCEFASPIFALLNI